MLYVGILIVSGMIGGKLARLLKAPSVTGYLLSGIIVGPAVLNVVTTDTLSNMSWFSNLALALIAFDIGAVFNIKNIKKLGKKIFIISIFEAGVAFIFVFIATFYLFKMSFAFSLMISAISCATAPAATIMVINQYRADGPLVKTLLTVVALDDAICIILFGISFSLSKTAISGEALSFLSMISAPLFEISVSLLLGGIAGLIFCLSHKYFKSDDDTLIALLGTVIVAAGVAIKFSLSPLLTCMMVGAMVANLLGDRKRIFHLGERFCPPIFLIFFTIAGATLHLSELTHVGLLGVAYVVARSLGKIIGSALGAKLTSSPKVVSNYLGLGLLPQAGVAIGLSSIVNSSIPSIGPKLMTIILGGVVFFEIVGPFSAKFAIQNAGEIGKRNMHE